MGLEVIQLGEFLRSPGTGVGFLSLKLEELTSNDLECLKEAIRNQNLMYDLLLHGTDGSELERELCTNARRTFAASQEIARVIKSFCPRVRAVYAPGAKMLERKSPVDCTLLTFGMAHKIRSDGYKRLARLLAQDRRSFRLEISTALHEGGTFDEAFFTVGEEISRAFAGNVRFLGFLADAEVSERLQSVDALVAFFPRGVRENNTTVLSAMAHGCPVITNLDPESPDWMGHDRTIFDIDKLEVFPSKSDLQRVGEYGFHATREFTFEKLAEVIRKSKD
jgi:glycosyltransferase involved in cell wall biosynthesis